MAQVAVMLPDGSVNKIDRDSQEGLQALRESVAFFLRAALTDSFAGIRLGNMSALKTVTKVFTLIQTEMRCKFLSMN